MRASLLRLHVEARVVDQDDAGDVIAEVMLEPVEFLGRNNLDKRVGAYLRDVDRLLRERTAELEASKPNRAARRRAASTKGKKR